MTLAELLALLANLATMSDEELIAAEEAAEALADERANASTDEELEELISIRDAVTAVRGEAASRAEAQDARAAAAAAALAEIRGDDGEDEESEDGEEADGEEEAPAEDAEAEETEEAPADAEAAAEQERIAAAATPRPPRISRVSARRPGATAPRASSGQASLPALGLVASANLPGFTAGESIDDAGKLADAFWSAVQSTAGYRHGPRVKVPIARAGSEDPTRLGWSNDRILDGDVRSNLRKIRDVTSPRALQASGGICAPPPVQYNLPILEGSDARPVRDEMLTRFGADRGGVVTLPPPILTDLDGAISVWTEANDASQAPNPATKACLEVTCPTEDETLVDAIVNCLQFGNFRARYFAEQIEAWIRLSAVNHARVAENRSLTVIGAGSTHSSHGQLLGSLPDFIAGLRLAAAALRNRHRLGRTFPLRLGAPAWFLDQLAADQARRLPYGTTDESYALAAASVERWLAAMNINVTWFEDGETGQIFGPQGDGPLNGWPSTAFTYLYPEGSWLFLDGGVLDLGIVRDSTLNSTNDVQMFSESFEATHFHGVESLRIVFDTCPDGSIAGTIDIDPCSTGS